MFDLKGLIQNWFTRKGKNPAEDFRSATIWVQQLPQADRQEALEDIIHMLQDTQQGENHIRERAKALLYIDDKAHGIHAQLRREYLSTLDQPKAEEKLFLPTILAYQEDMADAFQNIIKGYVEEPDKKLAEMIPLITARALHYYAQQIQWSYLRYLPGETMVWRYLQRLYLFAEREGFALNAFKLHPDARLETTCTAKFLQPQMLHLANPESLKPDQIALVAVWLENWTHSMLLEQDFRPQRQLFVVNLGDGKPARPLRRNMIGEKYRYLAVGTLLMSIDKTLEQLRHGELPARLKLGEECRLPGCADLIELVAQRWAGKGGTRRHERRASKHPVEAALGLAEILRHIANHTDGKKAPPTGQVAQFKIQPLMPDYASTPSDTTLFGAPELFESNAAQWIVENESPDGCCASFEASGGKLPKIGSLIGLRQEDTKQYAIGVVKRINQSVNSRTSLGLQIISQSPILIQLDGMSASGRGIKGVYLPEAAANQAPRTLLIASRYYQQNKIVALRAQGKAYSIRLRQPLEHNNDFTRSTFDVLAKLAPGN